MLMSNGVAPCSLRETTEVGTGAVPPQTKELCALVSMREPGLVAGMTLLSEPMRHFNWMFCPGRRGGKLTTVLM